MTADQPRDPRELAERFHEAYERLAPNYGYKTREESAVAWESVPENNRLLMEAVCAEVLTFVLAELDEARRERDEWKEWAEARLEFRDQRDEARRERDDLLRERQARTAELVRSLMPKLDAGVAEVCACAAVMCEQVERQRDDAEAERDEAVAQTAAIVEALKARPRDDLGERVRAVLANLPEAAATLLAERDGLIAALTFTTEHCESVGTTNAAYAKRLEKAETALRKIDKQQFTAVPCGPYYRVVGAPELARAYFAEAEPGREEPTA